jgi:hypothetical protein
VGETVVQATSENKDQCSTTTLIGIAAILLLLDAMIVPCLEIVVPHPRCPKKGCIGRETRTNGRQGHGDDFLQDPRCPVIRDHELVTYQDRHMQTQDAQERAEENQLEAIVLETALHHIVARRLRIIGGSEA